MEPGGPIIEDCGGPMGPGIVGNGPGPPPIFILPPMVIGGIVCGVGYAPIGGIVCGVGYAPIEP